MVVNRTSSRRLALGSALSLLALLASERTASAQDAAAADVLFNQARELTEKGDFAAACPKFEESERLDPGMGTLYRLGDCYEHIGRTASAWASFHEVMIQAKSAGQSAREADARQRAAALEKLLSHLTIEVPKSTDNVVIERDGAPVGAAQWGLSLPVDPGAHVLVAHAPGKIAWRATVNVAASEAVVAKVPPLADAPVPPAADTASPSPSTSRKTAGLVVGGVGVVALGVSGVFGLISMGHKSDVDKNCDPTNGCNQAGSDASKSAVHTGNVSTGFFIGGAILAAGGLVLYLTAPRTKSAASLRITPAIGGAALEGNW